MTPLARDHDRCLDALSRWLRTGALPRPADAGEAERLAAAAAVQGVAAILDDDLAAEASSSWPEDVRLRLRSAHRAALASVLHRLAVASDLQRALERAGLPSVALKGVALADTLYASPAHRPMDDVDLLVFGDWSAACRVMEISSYVAEIRGDHAWGFRTVSDPVFVELHASPISASAAFRIDTAGLLARSHSIPELPRRVPSLEDLLLLTALHIAFQHGLVARLGQWLDLRRLAEHPTLQVSSLLDRAAAWGAGPALALAVAAAEGLVGARVPWLRRECVPRPLAGRLPGLRPSCGLPLALTRWHLSRGRRVPFLLDTLAPRPIGGGPRPFGGIFVRLAHVLAQTARPG